jgi:hypothetical protein
MGKSKGFIGSAARMHLGNVGLARTQVCRSVWQVSRSPALPLHRRLRLGTTCLRTSWGVGTLVVCAATWLCERALTWPHGLRLICCSAILLGLRAFAVRRR